MTLKCAIVIFTQILKCATMNVTRRSVFDCPSNKFLNKKKKEFFMKKIVVSMFLVLSILVSTLAMPISAADAANTVTPTWEQVYSADNLAGNLSDGTTVEWDATENAMKVVPVVGKSEATRFRLVYSGKINAAENGVIALVVKPNGAMDAVVKTRTGSLDSSVKAGTADAKSAGAKRGESTTQGVSSWDLDLKPYVSELANGYKLLFIDLDDLSYNYGKTADGTKIELINGCYLRDSNVMLLPTSSYKGDPNVDFFHVKSAAIFKSKADALTYYSASVPAVAEKTCAYTVGDKFVSYVQADDADYTVLGKGESWTVKETEGAMGGKALYCNTKADNASGDGFSITFAVPAEGDYTIWGRVFYPSQTSNSMHYSVDDGQSLVWDLVDDKTSDAYGKWQYFYLTKRTTGTYTDTTKYGEWTIANNEHRHAANVLHLTAGQHTIKITGREAGMYIDEFVITNYSASEYDPNAFEGNTAILDKCQFCGTDCKHYISDLYAQKGATAQTYFTMILHDDAVEWDIPEVTLPVIPDDEPEDTTGGNTGNTGNTDNNTNNKPADTSNTDTQAPADSSAEDTAAEEKKGCGGSVNVGALMIVALVAAAGVVTAKKRTKTSN